MQAQLAQERYRADNASYGSLAEAGLRGMSAAGHYTVQSSRHSADGYAILASATGAPGARRGLPHLRLTLADATLAYASGPDAAVANGADVNRRCWSR